MSIHVASHYVIIKCNRDVATHFCLDRFINKPCVMGMALIKINSIVFVNCYSRRVFDTVRLLNFLLGTHTETWIRFSCIWTIISNKEQYTLKCKIGNAMKFHRKVILISQISNFIVIKTISCGSICVFCCDQSDGCNAITWPGCCYTRLWVMCACLRVPLDSRFLTHTPTCRLKNHMRLLYLSNDCLKLLDYVRKGKPVLGCKIHASVLLVLHVNVYRIYRQTSPKQGKTQFYTRAAKRTGKI